MSPRAVVRLSLRGDAVVRAPSESTHRERICITHRKGEQGSKKLVIAAHMDEIGFVVRHVDDSGYVRFGTLGGFDPNTLTAQRVLVHARSGHVLGVMGSNPIHLMTDEERKQSPGIEHYFIDLGLPVDEVKEKVREGDR